MDQSTGLEPALAPTPAIPAPYGKACVGCVKAKCKCLARSGSSSCERCLRLGRECQPSDLTRKRKKKANTLEAKVDGILSLLQAVNEAPKEVEVNTLAFRTPGNVTLVGHPFLSTQGTVENQITGHNRQDILGPISVGSTSSLAGNNSSDSVTPALLDFSLNASELLSSASYSAFGPSIEESKGYLTEFRTQKLIYFPFIHLPACTAIERLQEERPFLFLAIMAVSSRSSSQRQGLGREVKQILAREFIVNNEGSLDVLVGLLVFLAWGHDQFVHAQLMSRYMHLAISMLFDLGLNKRPLKEPFILLDIGSSEGEKEQAHPSTRTMEERRTVLGCFVLSSIVSWYFSKLNALRWTPYLEECLLELSSAREYPGDEIFAHQVRLQLIVHKVTECSNAYSESSEASRAPLPFYLKAFQSQQLEVQRSLPADAEGNVLLRAFMHHTTLTINALALSKDPLITNTTTFTRIDCLSTCLISIKSWFEIFFTVLPSEYLNLSFPFMAQLMHSIVVLHRLSTLEDPAWDLGLVTETIDITVVLGQLIEKFRMLEDKCEEVTEREMFGKLAMVFDWVRNLPKSKLAGAGRGEVADGGEAVQIEMEDIGDVGMQEMMGGVDDTWLNEMLGSWSYDFMSR